MALSVAGPRRGWHPVTGAVLVAAPALLVAALPVLAGLGAAGAGGALSGLTAFLVMGAVAGFSVSGST